MSYQLILAPRAERQLDLLDAPVRGRITRALDILAQDPYRAANVRPLHGGGYRLRIGDYRALFDLRDATRAIVIIEVAHRREVYRRR